MCKDTPCGVLRTPAAVTKRAGHTTRGVHVCRDTLYVGTAAGVERSLQQSTVNNFIPPRLRSRHFGSAIKRHALSRLRWQRASG